MDPENKRPRHGGMKQVVIDRTLETGDHNRSQQQRHRKIEIPLHNPVSTTDGDRARFSLRASSSPDAFCVHSGHGRVTVEPGPPLRLPGPREDTPRLSALPSFSDSFRYLVPGGCQLAPKSEKLTASESRWTSYPVPQARSSLRSARTRWGSPSSRFGTSDSSVLVRLSRSACCRPVPA